MILFYIQAYAYQGDYGTESVFSAGAGARAEAMGGAFAAIGGDASSVYYNPAGLAVMEKQSAMFLHYPLYETAIYDAASYAVPLLDFGTISAAVYRFSSGSLAGYDSQDKPTAAFSSEEYKATASYAGKISAGLYAGLSANVFSAGIADFHAAGFGADAGLLYEPFDFLSAAFVIHNLIKPGFVMKNSVEGLAQRYTLGLALKAAAAGFVFRLASDCSFGEAEAFKNSSGAEISWLEILSGRAGYNDGRFSFGGGVRALGGQADYAFVSGGLPGGLHKFTFSYSFGATLSEQRDQKRRALLEEVRKLVDKKMAAKSAEKSAEYYTKAYAFYKTGDLEAALVETEKAVDWQPSNDNAIKMKVFLAGRLKERFYAEAREGINAAKNQFFDQGVDYYIRKQYTRALAEWEKARGSAPAIVSIAFYINKARQKAGLKQGQPAAAVTKDASEKMYYEAVNAYTAGDLEKAVALWNRVISMDPENTKSIRNIEKAQAEIAELAKRGVK